MIDSVDSTGKTNGITYMNLNLSYLIINGIKLGENDPINKSGVGHVGVVRERLVELDKLINSLVAHQSLSHKQYQVRLIYLDQLQEKMVSILNTVILLIIQIHVPLKKVHTSFEVSSRQDIIVYFWYFPLTNEPHHLKTCFFCKFENECANQLRSLRHDSSL